MNNFNSLFKETVEILEEKNLKRNLQTMELLPDSKVLIGEKKYLNLSSNDYLGLSHHPALKKASLKAVNNWGTGSAASRLVTGNNHLYEILEKRVSLFKKKEKSLIFSCGYMANVGILSSILTSDDIAFSDELNHASIIDGLRMSKARVYVYKHNDTSDLEHHLRKAGFKQKRLIITDTVFSMDGDIASLDKIVKIKKKYGAFLMVDEAHATGVLGNNGAGASQYFNVEKDIDIIMGTFSKALGSYGAYVSGNSKLIDFLINKARSFIFTTALPPSVLLANITALEVVEKNPELIEKLKSNAKVLIDGLINAGFNILPTATAIIPLIVGKSKKAVELSEELFKEGIIAKAIRPPTVPEGTARIRITASASQNRDELIKSVEIFKKCGKKLKIV